MNKSYKDYIVLQALAQGSQPFEEIARRAFGLYPQGLRLVLNKLIAAGEVVDQDNRYYLRPGPLPLADALETIADAAQGQFNMPEPHPGDYDWRFDKASCQRLTELAVKESLLGRSVVLLGTPSIFLEIAHLKHPPKTVLFDNNQSLIQILRHYQLPAELIPVYADLLTDFKYTFTELADVVVCDPPWYYEHYLAFLYQAALAARDGGVVAISLMPINTRPSAVAERQRIIEKAYEIGLHLQLIEHGAIRYPTPTFERKSLESQGILLSENWRYGDLAIFRQVIADRSSIQEWLNKNPVDVAQEHWLEIMLGHRKIKLRGPLGDLHEPPELFAIEEDDQLPTVNRQYNGREHIDLWLSDNRVFGIRGKAAFWAALLKLADCSLPEDLQAIEAAYQLKATALLQRIL